MPLYQRPTGTLDTLPEDQAFWDHVRSRVRYLSELAGFERIDVPVFEATELFARGIGAGTDVVDKEMYTFTDKGDHQLTLRPEFTAGVLRAYIENGLHARLRPQKLYSIGPVFRYDRPQAGRYRQFTQFNAEIVGEQDPAADTGIMMLVWDLYSGLGFRELEFQLNSTGCPKCRPGYVESLKDYYAGQTDLVCDDCRSRLERSPLRVLDCKNERCQPVIDKAPHFLDHLCPECAQHFQGLRDNLELTGRTYMINHRLVRGLDYYTKTVFEVWAAGIGAQAAVCGGGRYDGLVELLGGKPTPGVGVAVGLERIILVMKDLGVTVPETPRPQAYVAHLGKPAAREALQIADNLRREGIRTWLAYGERRLKSQLREAGRRNAVHAIIIGEDELAEGRATVRNMETGSQASVRLERLVAWVRERS